MRRWLEYYWRVLKWAWNETIRFCTAHWFLSSVVLVAVRAVLGLVKEGKLPGDWWEAGELVLTSVGAVFLLTLLINLGRAPIALDDEKSETIIKRDKVIKDLGNEVARLTSISPLEERRRHEVSEGLAGCSPEALELFWRLPILQEEISGNRSPSAKEFFEAARLCSFIEMMPRQGREPAKHQLKDGYQDAQDWFYGNVDQAASTSSSDHT